MVKHERTRTTWKATRGKREEEHLILGHINRNPNPYVGSMESVRVTVGEDLKKKEAPMFLDIRNWVESTKYTGPSRTGGVRLDRHIVLELLSMLPEIKKAMGIDDDEILDAIDERKTALSKQKEKE